MSRIRSIKPEMWTSDDFLALTTEGQLAFVWLFSNADDEGRLKTNEQHISRVLGVGDVTAQLDEMVRRHMIKRYEVAGNHYIVVCSFTTHQRIDRPKPSSLPAPPNTKPSSRNRRAVVDTSPPHENAVVDASSLARPQTDRPTERPIDQTETRASSGVSDETDEPPIQNPSIQVARVVEYVHARDWLCTSSDHLQLSRMFRANPAMLAEDWVGLWEEKPGLANPWALAFTRSGKDPKNCTLVELRMRRRVEGIEAARHKAVRDEERLYAAGTP